MKAKFRAVISLACILLKNLQLVISNFLQRNEAFLIDTYFNPLDINDRRCSFNPSKMKSNKNTANSKLGKTIIALCVEHSISKLGKNQASGLGYLPESIDHLPLNGCAIAL